MQKNYYLSKIILMILGISQILILPANAAQPTDNVAIVQINGGSFEMLANKEWVEKNQINQVKFRFVEQNRTKISILLFDASRNVHLALIIPDRKILYSHKGEEFRKIYDIINVSTKPIPTTQQIQCGENYEWQHDKCVLKQNCGENAFRNVEGDCFCKKNYELQNGKCLWKSDNNGFEKEPWLKPECKELQRLCDRGVDKACMQYEGTCQVN